MAKEILVDIYFYAGDLHKKKNVKKLIILLESSLSQTISP